MASQNKEEDMKCEYVYEKDKGMPENDATIFDGEYSDGDSDKDGSELRVKPVSTNNEKLKSSSNIKSFFFSLSSRARHSLVNPFIIN